MGIIRKQSIYSSIFIYVGFIIGAINIYFLSSVKYFTPEQYGLTRLLIDVSLLFATLCTVGSVPVTYKFFPFYTTYLSKKKNDLPFLTVTSCIIGCFLMLLLTSIFKENIIRKFGAKSPLFVTYFNLLYPLTITFTFLILFEANAWGLRKTVLSNFLKEVSFRVVVFVLILLFITHSISVDIFFKAYSFIYLPGTFVLLIILIRSGKFPINFSISSITRRLYQKILTFGLFIFSGSVLNVLSRTVDVIIISSQSVAGLKDTAVFVTATYLITLMEVPQRSIVAIATPIIAEAWKERNLKRIHELYQKTSLNLLIIGLAIWGCILLNMDNAVNFLGSHYAPMKEIVIIMGFAKLVDLGTGLNSQILLLSKFWRIDFITNMLFVVMSIPLNYILINKYGVIGSAFANLIALTVFNFIRFFYILKLYKLQPFTPQTIYALLIAFACMAVVYFIPRLTNIFVDVILRAALFMLCFSTTIISLKISADITGLYKLGLQKIRSRQ